MVIMLNYEIKKEIDGISESECGCPSSMRDLSGNIPVTTWMGDADGRNWLSETSWFVMSGP